MGTVAVGMPFARRADAMEDPSGCSFPFWLLVSPSCKTYRTRKRTSPILASAACWRSAPTTRLPPRVRMVMSSRINLLPKIATRLRLSLATSANCRPLASRRSRTTPKSDVPPCRSIRETMYRWKRSVPADMDR